MGTPSKKVQEWAKKERKRLMKEGGGTSSTTTWKQTPTSRAVDDKKIRKKFKAWSKGGRKGRQPAGYAPAVGSVAQTKRKTTHKTDAKGGKTTRSVTDFEGPRGMVPEHLYGDMLKPKKKK